MLPATIYGFCRAKTIGYLAQSVHYFFTVGIGIGIAIDRDEFRVPGSDPSARLFVFTQSRGEEAQRCKGGGWNCCLPDFPFAACAFLRLRVMFFSRFENSVGLRIAIDTDCDADTDPGRCGIISGFFSHAKPPGKMRKIAKGGGNCHYPISTPRLAPLCVFA
jgi:hypothetical protein